MIVHTFPPMGSVGGSIRIVKFLKYITELREDIHSTIITIRDDIVLLNDLHLSKSSLSQIPAKNVSIVRTNTLQPRHPNPDQHLLNGKDKIRIGKKEPLFNFKVVFKKIYSFFEKYFLIPDYSILWGPSLILRSLKYSKQTDLIYATAPPFSVLILAVIIKKIIHKKLILDIKDDWIHQPRLKMQPYLFRKFEEKMERFCINNADSVILVTQSSFEDFKLRYPNFVGKFELICNGCDIDEYKDYWDNHLTKNTKFSIIHSGVIGTSRNPESLFDSLDELKKEGIISQKNFELIFIGPLPQNILQMIKGKKLVDIIITSPVLDREDYIRTIINADLLLAINYQIKTLIPGKLYDYWGSRRPILLLDSLDSIAAKLVIENNLGVVRNFSDTAGIKESIKYFFDLWNSNALINKTGIENLYNYDRKKLTGKLLNIIDTI